MKNLISICVILSTAILANVSQATLAERYCDKSAEDLYRWGDKSNFYGSNYPFDGYLNHRQGEGSDFDILLLSSKDFVRRHTYSHSVGFLLVIENYPTAYFGQNGQIRQPVLQNSTLARTLSQHSFRSPLERLLGNDIEGRGMWLQNGLFVSNTRLAENRHQGQKTSNPAPETAKRRSDRRLVPTLRREQRYDPRGREEEQTGPKPVGSRKIGSKPLLLTEGNGIPIVIESRALRYRFHEFYVNRGYYSESGKHTLWVNKRKGLPTLAHGLYSNQQYIPNRRVGVELWGALGTMDSNSGKIHNIDKSTHVDITGVTPVSSSANDWPTTTTQILNGQVMLGKLAQAG